MRVLVCGGRMFGRPYPDGDAADLKRAVKEALAFDKYMNSLHEGTPITWIIEGGAEGADSLAHGWAEARAINLLIFRPDWNAYGRVAGPIRNRRMLEEGKPDLVVAFPGGKGTANMVGLARRAGVRVIEPISQEPTHAD